MTDETHSPKGDDNRVELTALVILGWILPLAGFVYGPGEWWAYVIWLAVGTAVILGYEALRGSEDEPG